MDRAETAFSDRVLACTFWGTAVITLGCGLLFGAGSPALGVSIASSALVIGLMAGRRAAVGRYAMAHASELMEVTEPDAALPQDEFSRLEMQAPSPDVIDLATERLSRQSAAAELPTAVEEVAEQLSEFPAFVNLMTLHLESVTRVSQDATEKLMPRLLEVDGRMTSLLGYVQSAGSGDSSERILANIENQLSTCRTQLGDLGAQQAAASQEAIAFRDRLTKDTKDVLGVLNGVHRMARQTTMLSLNVSIEAARVGDLGKGFAVIGHEIRELASEVQQLADDVHERVSGLMADVESGLSHQSRRREESENAAMRSVSDALGSLSGNLERMLEHHRDVLARVRTENEEIAEPIMAMMASMQFQDIVRQQIEQITAMTSAVGSHISSLGEGLREPARLSELGTLSGRLDTLAASYVMREQREIHGSVLGEGATAEAAVARIELF